MNIAFVPARSGSISIKNKNIKLFCKKPLIYWTLKSLEKSKIIDKIFLATDGDLIKKVAYKFKFKKLEIFNRSKKNAKNHSKTEDVLLEFLKKKNFDKNDYIFLAQPTNPFVKSADYEVALKELKRSKKKSLVTVAKSNKFFWNLNGKSINYDFKKRPRRQDFNSTFIENGAFYINQVKNIDITKNRLTEPVHLFVMGANTIFELDEPSDWVIGETIKKYNL